MKHFYPYFLAVAMLFAVGCDKDNTEEDTNGSGGNGKPGTECTLSVDPGSTTISARGDTFSTVVSSSAGWTLSGGVSWCEPSKTSGGNGETVTFTIEPNTTSSERNVTYTFWCGDKSAKLTITQKQKDALTVTKSKYEVDAGGDDIRVEVKANIPFDYEIAANCREWITPLQTRAMTTSTLIFKIAENPEASRREGTIVIRSGNLSETVSVYQAGFTPAIVISRDKYIVSDKGETIKVEVNSNVEYTVEMPAVDWITENAARSVSSHTHYYTISPNESYDQRSAQIIFKSKENNALQQVVTVTQVQKDAIILGENTLTVLPKGGTLDLEVQSNVDYTVTVNDNWIHHIQTRALQTSTIHLTVDPNPEPSNPRAGSISISAGNITQRIIITQISSDEYTAYCTIYYTTDDNKSLTPTSSSGFGANIVSNTYVDGQGKIIFDAPVTSIGDSAFYNCASLTSITIPTSVTSIGKRAFSGDFNRFPWESKLESITIPEGVTEIGNGAFAGCSRLTSITIPERVTEIENETFNDCFSLTSITIPEGVTEIGNYAFADCSRLTSIVIPEGVTEIGNGAFSKCSRLTSIVIPEGVTKIRDYVFSSCFSLTSITIPEGVTEIGYGAFENCKSLTSSITIPEGVTEIKMATFRDCLSLTSITIPSTVTRIDDTAFTGYSGEVVINCNISVSPYGPRSVFPDINKVIIGEGVTEIGNYAFAECSKLTNITIPSSVTSIGERAFMGCKRLEDITIPERVTKIKRETFRDCSRLDITIPEGVTEIGDRAFTNCAGKITIPSSITWIGKEVFSSCWGQLTINCNIPSSFKSGFGSGGGYSIIIGEGVTLIESGVFAGAGVRSITIPSSITSIKDDTFKNCSQLTSVTLSKGLTSIGKCAFDKCKNLISITIPEGVTEIGNGAFGECSRLTSITIPSTVTSIGAGAFQLCENLTSVTLSKKLTSIGAGAFQYCENLTSITIPEGVTEIGDGAFQYCENLTNITIPEGVTKIRAYTFYECTSLHDITIPEGVTEIECNAFEWCARITEVIIPSSVTSIGNFAFSRCSILTRLVFKEGSLISIGEYAFQLCKNLSRVKLPSSVTTIKRSAFAGTKLSFITIPENVTSIGIYAFDPCSEIYCHPIIPPTCDGGISNSCVIYVPQASIETYKSSPSWSAYADQIIGRDFTY